MRSALLAIMLLAGLFIHALAQPQTPERSKVPQSQRLLTGEDAKSATALAASIRKLEDAGKYAEALRLAEDLLALRRRIQGADHWETADAEWRVKTLRPVQELPVEKQQVWTGLAQQIKEAAQLSQKGRYAAGETLRRQILERTQEFLTEEHPETSSCYHELASDIHHQGRHPEAEALYRKSLAILQRTLGELNPRTATTYESLALALQEQHREQEAEALLRHALDCRQKLWGEDHVETARSYVHLALSLGNQGKAAAAEPLLRKALAIIQATHGDDHEQMGWVSNNLAHNLNAQGKNGEAEPFYRKALRLTEKHNGEEHPNTAVACSNLAAALRDLGRPGEAEPLFRRALAIRVKLFGEDHPETAVMYNNLAFCLSAQNRAADSESFYRKALAIQSQAFGKDHVQTSVTLGNLADCLGTQGKHAEAEPLAQRVVTIRRKALGLEHPFTLYGYLNLAGNLQAQSKLPEAIEVLEIAARCYESARLSISSSGLGRAGFGQHLSPYGPLAAILARTGRATAAWQALEFDLARGLLDDARGRRGDDLSAEQRQHSQALSQELARLQSVVLALVIRPRLTDADQQKLDELLQARAKLESELAQLAAERSRREVFALEQIQKHLPPDAALIAWVDIADRRGSIEENWGCLVRAQGEPAWIRLPRTGADGKWTTADAQLARRLPQALVLKDDLAGATDHARRLAAQRLAPLETHLRGVKHLFVVSAGAMAGVPVEPLSDAYTVSYVPSGTQLARLLSRARARVAAEPRSTFRLLAVGDPAYVSVATDGKLDTRAALPRLPGTAREVASIAALFDKPTVLLGSEASESELALRNRDQGLKGFQILHFATHGKADASRALESALILSTDGSPDTKQSSDTARPRNGRLTAKHVLDDWTLEAELVVLSACESGLGPDAGGEGLLGFSQAFLLAGSRSVILSLWQVNDTATALLMFRFYQNWLGKRPGLNKPLSKAESLREAKHWLRNLQRDEIGETIAKLPEAARGLKLEPVDPAKPGAASTKPFEHPYYWSAFVLIGDPE
jgi:CHAT domain-containing protein